MDTASTQTENGDGRDPNVFLDCRNTGMPENQNLPASLEAASVEGVTIETTSVEPDSEETVDDFLVDDRAIRIGRTETRGAQTARRSRHGFRRMPTTTMATRSGTFERRIITRSSTFGREARQMTTDPQRTDIASRIAAAENIAEAAGINIRQIRDQARMANLRTANLLSTIEHIRGSFRDFPVPMPPQEIPKIPIIRISDDHLDKECCVCFENFILDEEVLHLKCGHMYHKDCILPWLRTCRTCPHCRMILADLPHENQQNLLRFFSDRLRQIEQEEATSNVTMDTNSVQ